MSSAGHGAQDDCKDKEGFSKRIAKMPKEERFERTRGYLNANREPQASLWCVRWKFRGNPLPLRDTRAMCFQV